MKIINGTVVYSKSEVAQIVGRSPQTINLWDKWSTELADSGKPRLIPAPIRMDNNYRFWTQEAVEKIKVYAQNIKYGDLSDFSKRQWGNRNEQPAH